MTYIAASSNQKYVAVFPVVHVRDAGQALDQASMAVEAGADGVYLIDHDGGSPEELLDIYQQVRTALETAFIGLNVLHCSSGLDVFTLLSQAWESSQISSLPDGIWVDDASPHAEDLMLLRDIDDDLAAIRYLGGTSFKYTTGYSDNPMVSARAARDMAAVVDVVCTSGPGTGQAPSTAKVKAMKEAIGSQPLAIASGVDQHNIDQYRQWTNEILVASSIETEPYSGIFERQELDALISACRNLPDV